MPSALSLRRLTALAAAVCALGSVSCDGGGPALHPVRGAVLFDGAPADGASVVFQPVGGAAGAAMPSGTAGADGAFTLRSHPGGEGAAAGDYLVLVTWYPANSREQANPKNRLPAKYAGPDSPLKVTVKPGDNSLDAFQLTK